MTIARVRYEERQRLLAADFRAEQAYRLALAGRHMLAPHQWGIVSGLRIVRRDAGWFLQPGLATDGDGREIVVPDVIRLRLPDAPCVFVVLFYCEFPEQLDPPRCPDTPAPRIGHRYRVLFDDEFVAPVLDPALEQALAAGPKSGTRPWPVLLGQIGTPCFKPNEEQPPDPVRFTDARYVTHRAGSIRTPTGRATLQLGPSGHEDIYHFLLSTKNAQGSIDRRIGVDRDGDIRVWKNLTVIGSVGVGEMNLGGQLSVRVKVPMPAVPAPRVLVSARLDRETAKLTTFWTDSAGTSLVSEKKIDRSQHLDTDVRFPDRRAVRIALLEAQKPVLPFTRPAGQKTGPRSEPRFESVTAEARPTDGVMIMRRPAEVEVPVDLPECGDVERTRAARRAVGPPVARFTAGKNIQAHPQLREMFQLDRSDLVPRSEFRISGGAFDENDPHTRLSIGDGRDGGWSPAFAMSGAGKLVLGRPYGANPPPTALAVNGTVYLPPVGKDDPLLPSLMAQAFMAGLLQMGQISTDVTVAFTPPAKIVSGNGFQYTLTLTRAVANQTVKIKKCLELIRVVEGGTDIVVTPVEGLPGELTSSTPVNVTVPHPAFTIAGDKVRIAIQLLIAVGSVTRVVEKESDPVPVEHPIT